MDNLSTLILDCILKNNVVKWVIALFYKIVFWIKQILSIKPKTESMKLQNYKNIDLVQINVKAGVQEYYLPKNVDWADCVIDKILVYDAYDGGNGSEVSPIDGTTRVIQLSNIEDMYFDLYNNEEVEIAHNLNATAILHSNNNPVEIKSKLSLNLSRIFLSTPIDQDGCLLLYVFYGAKEVETDDRPQRSVTVQFSLSGGEQITLSSVIDTYIHSQDYKVKGIDVWKGLGYLTLRDYNNHCPILNLLHTRLCRPLMGTEYTVGEATPEERCMDVQMNPLYLDNVDIDFDNSFILSSYPKDEIAFKQEFIITFYY